MKFWRYMFLLLLGVIAGIVIADKGMLSDIQDLASGSDVIVGSGDDSAISVDDKIDNIADVLESQYFDQSKIDDAAMKKRAVKAYVDGLGDPFTVYLDNEEHKELENGLAGSEDFEGIGAKVMKKDNGVMIEEVLKGSPALTAGLKPLDVIVEIDGQSVADETLRESVKRIRGPKDTDVVLKVWRGFISHDDSAEPEVLDITVTRGSISYPSVVGEIWEIGDKKVGYVVISSVGETTVDIFREVIGDFRSKNVDAVVLDLRGNGGGFLDESVEILSYMVPPKTLVVQGKYRIYRDDAFLSKAYAGVQGKPIVVMVDEYTASAGEIIALALREVLQSTVIGTTTFGKGTIQTLMQFDDGSSLKYTVGERLPPSGQSINGTGVVPDIEMAFDREQFSTDATDNQIEFVKKYLQKRLENM